ncbi:MAG: hypothetical protein JNJ88_16385 [Planctomycetes bacterium]|nr:hypothetical protein [Planctomycetota bacterium]
MADRLDFYNEHKYCPSCREYVRFLASLNRSYCAQCGEVVNLFSKDDWKKFRRKAAAPEPPKKGILASTKKPRRLAEGE